MAVRGDPPSTASAGDTVQLWRRDGTADPQRVGTGELRASVGTVATIATDETIARQIDPTAEYRLLTPPADPYADREFAAMLRRADETMQLVEISGDSPLVGQTIGTLEVTVIAVRSPEGTVTTIPTRDRPIEPGDGLFAIGRPDAFRKLDTRSGTQTAATGFADDQAAAVSFEQQPTSGQPPEE